MPIWTTIPVTEQSALTLMHWRIFETDDNERHFVGYCLENREGRVSSAIEHFDAETGRGVTEFGRVYQLRGNPGVDGDAAYVWQNWVQIFDVQSFRDVTNEVAATLQMPPAH